MADAFHSPIPSSPVGGAAPASRGTETGPAKSDVEFQALLERVEQRARKLAADAAGVEVPEQLAQAMETARESLEDVMSLQQRLLEAYRAEQRRPGVGSD